jgi:hypothetical protein
MVEIMLILPCGRVNRADHLVASSAKPLRRSSRCSDARTRPLKSDGRLVHKTIGTVLQNRADAYVQDAG